MNKRATFVLFSLVVVVVVALTSGITAYLTDGDSADNNLSIGGNRVEIVEEFTPPEELLPGVVIPKNVMVTNVGPSDCYVRVMAVFSNGDMKQYCEVDWNTSNWVLNSTDGYWYYTKPIATGESTPSLFTTITIDDSAPADAIVEFDMIVYAESYQSAGSNSYTEAWANYQTNKPN